MKCHYPRELEPGPGGQRVVQTVSGKKNSGHITREPGGWGGTSVHIWLPKQIILQPEIMSEF